MIVMKTRVIAEAWISVSRSGHWTRRSSAMQEAKNPRTPPRWRFSAGAGSLGARRRSESLARCLSLLLLLAAGPAADLVGGLRVLRGRADVRSRRGGRFRLVVRAALELVEVDATLGELGLDHVGRLADLGVVLGA